MSVMPLNEPLEARVEKLEDWKTEQVIADNVRGVPASKADVDRLDKRFDALLKTLWAISFLVAGTGLTFIASHVG
jgi:hypothetical protein